MGLCSSVSLAFIVAIDVFSYHLNHVTIYHLFSKDIFPDKATERKILSFTIKCSSEGCDWTGELREKEVQCKLCSMTRS